MKYIKIFRILCVAIFVSLLLATVPAATAQAAASITLSPTEGKIGDRITVTGTGFNKSTAATDKYAAIYFSSDEASIVDDIGDEVTHYRLVKEGVWLDEYGEFEITFRVPDILDDGADEEDVQAGTYYVYVCHYLNPPTIVPRIRAVAKFTVIIGEITLYPEKGPVGTEVKISGKDFGDREDIFIEYDGNEIRIEAGDDKTDRNGEFEGTIIIIPESTGGDHIITVVGDDSEIEVKVTFAVEPEITTSPTSGAVGTTVTVKGTGFGYKSDFAIYIDGTEVTTGSTDRSGNFKVTFNVPAVKSGTYDLKVWDEDNNLDKVNFTIIATSANLKPTAGHVGAEVIVSGTGYIAGTTVTISYDTTKVATAIIVTGGTFSTTFKVPPSKYGDHNVTVSDGTTTKQLTFTMESEAPPTPKPLMPEMGVKVESPVHFDWEDVTDDSLPVTYTLQIATGIDFSASSMVLEKKGLTESEYTTTEKEKLESTSKKEPYYWRVRAIDGASNESMWTGNGEFYVGAVFAIPGWVVYVLLGIIAALLFVLGYFYWRCRIRRSSA